MRNMVYFVFIFCFWWDLSDKVGEDLSNKKSCDLKLKLEEQEVS